MVRVCLGSDSVPLIVGWFLVHMLDLASTVSVSIDAHPPGDRSVHAGTRIRIRCSTERTKLLPTFGLLRQRLDQRQAHLVEDVSESNTTEAGSDMIMKEFRLTLSPEDNGATFFCEVVSSGTFINVARSNGQYYNVTYAPMQLQVTASPVGSVAESVTKVFTCQLNDSGSNPSSELLWIQLDSAGARLPLNEVQISHTEQLVGRYGAAVARSNLTVTATRASNGRRFECNAVYLGKKTMLRSEEILEVNFPPNNVRLIAQPMNGVREAGRLELTCVTSTCHPPAVIRWFVLPPATANARNVDSSGSIRSELTDLAQLDSSPGEFGGTKVSSKLIVAKTYRSDQNTVYRCQVEHPGMVKPSINEHVLQVLFPPSIQVVTLPLEPVVGQNVLLSCQTSGGSPQSGFIYSWFVGGPSQLISGKDSKVNRSTETQVLSGTVKQPSQPSFDKMLRLTNQNDAYLNLSQVQLNQRGWYACKVANTGGETHAFFLLDLFYPPVVDTRTQSKVMAHIGESASFLLYLDANPPWTEASWFQVTKSDASRPTVRMGSYTRQQEAFYGGVYANHPYGEYFPYDMRRVKRETIQQMTKREARSPVGHGEGGRSHITARRGPSDGRENLTFTLQFDSVQREDFGHYVCQILHHLGVKTFDFQLMQKSGFEGIIPSSVTVIQRGATTLVKFSPPVSPPYSRIVLRVCRRDQPQETISSVDSRRSSGIRFFHPRRVNTFYPHINSADQLSRTNVHEKPNDSASRPVPGCEDYLVAEPLSGQTEVRLADAVMMYNFRLLVFQGSRLIQETPVVYWQPDATTNEATLGIPLTALAVAGGCVLFLITLILAGILFVYCGRRRKSAAQSRPCGFKNKYSVANPTHKSCIGSDDSEHQRGRTGGLGLELRSDLGSMQSYQASELEAIPLIRQVMSVQNGSFDVEHSGVTSACSPRHLPRRMDGDYDSLLRSQNSASGNLIAGVGMLSNRMMADAYIAAARAASAAVAASALSGSTDLYAPSSQMTGDLASPVQGTSDRDNQSLKVSQQDCVSGELVPTSVTQMDQKRDGQMSGRRSSNLELSGSNHKTNLGRIYENQYPSQLLIPSGSRGSRLSVQVGSPWGSVSGASLTRQASVEAAARAAAAAAVASVMQHMSTSFVMHHAASSNHLNAHQYLATRPASRAASVAGPSGKAGMESGDGESLHSAAFGPLYTTNPCSTAGELTPTSSLSPLDPSLLVVPATQQLTVPVVQRQLMHARLPNQASNSESQFNLRQAIGTKSPGHHILSRMDQISAHRAPAHAFGSRESVAHRMVPASIPAYAIPSSRQTGLMYPQSVAIFHPMQQGYIPMHAQYTGIMPGFNSPPQLHYQQQSQQTTVQSHLVCEDSASSPVSSSQSGTLTTQPDEFTLPQCNARSRDDRQPVSIIVPQNPTPNGPHSGAQEFPQNRAATANEDDLAHRETGVGGYFPGDANQCSVNNEQGAATPKPTRRQNHENRQDASGEAATSERSFQSTVCYRGNVLTTEEKQSIASQSNDSTTRRKEEMRATTQDTNTPSLRKSPVGASLNAIGNGNKLSDDEQHPTAGHQVISDSTYDNRQPPPPHKKQPRLGVHSPRRANKLCEDNIYNKHEPDRSPPTQKLTELSYTTQIPTVQSVKSTHSLLPSLPNGSDCV